MHRCFTLRIMESKERGSGCSLENSEIFSVHQLSDDHLQEAQHSEATLLNSSAAASEHQDIIPTPSFFISYKKKGSLELCGSGPVFLKPASWDATSCPALPHPALHCVTFSSTTTHKRDAMCSFLQELRYQSVLLIAGLKELLHETISGTLAGCAVTTP